MITLLTRRSLAAAAFSLMLGGGRSARAQAPAPRRPFASNAVSTKALSALKTLEAVSGGRLGVAALDTGSKRRIDYRAHERFAMCSTHKFLTAAAILNEVDHGRLKLELRVPYGRADLLEYAPITRKNVDAGFMTVDGLCAAALEWSDNTAEDLLLGLIGGPAGWTRYARSIGDTTSRLDRIEPALNSAIPGDPRDTTTPDAMIRDLDIVLLGKALGHVSRSRIETWLLDSKITGNLLHAGLPRGWRIGDKSGSGEHGTRNDIGIILPQGAAPILAAVYFTESTEPLSSREKVIVETGRIIAQTLGA
jgi:beta-lactamase class A